MTEDKARSLVRPLTDRAGMARLERLVELVLVENTRQNLIAASTIDVIWSRHILDSVQLLQWAKPAGWWIDIGTGGGFPGLAVAAASSRPIILVESRRRRADFLKQAVSQLNIADARVFPDRIENLTFPAETISARAVASIDQLFTAGIACSTATTRWLMPRGRRYEADMAQARSKWHGLFHVEQSISDPGGHIVVASEVCLA